MKKRLCSILLVLVMAISLLPTAAFAAGGDFDVDIVATKFSTVKYNEKETMKLDFMMKTSNGAKVRGIQTALLFIDTTKYDILGLYDGTAYDYTATACPSDGTVGTPEGVVYSNYKTGTPPMIKKITGKVAGKTIDGKAFLSMNADAESNEFSFDTSISMMSILLGLKDGVNWSNLPSDSIRLATAAEAKTFNATGVVTVNDSDGNAFVFRPKDGAGSDTLTIAPTLASDGSFSFVEPPKPPYPGTIDAPKVNSNAGGKVELNDAVLNPADSAAKIKYGYSKTNDGKNITWQDSTAFSSLNVGETYYFYAKVVETEKYKEKVSAASAAVPVADKAAPTITTLPTASVTYGDAVADSALTGGVASPGGTFHWMSGVTDYGDAGTKTLKAKFVPTDTAAYATVENIDVAVTVSAKALTDVAVGDIAAQAYTGSQITPAVEVKGDGGKKLVKDKDYTVDYGANNTTGTGAGTVTVKAKTGGNYTFAEVVKHFNIQAGSADDTLKENLKATHTPYTGTYDGAAHDAFTVDTTALGALTGWSVAYSTNGTSYNTTMPMVENVADSGNIYVKFSHASYADVIAEYEVKITQKSISGMLDVTLDHDSFVYDGNDKTVAVTSVKTNGGTVTLTPTSDYTIDSGSTMTAKNVPEGAGYPVVVAGTGNYTGTHTVYWKITKATPDASDFTIPSPSATVEYTGNPISVTAPSLKPGKTGAGAVTVYYEGVSASGTTYTKSTTAPTNVGTYNVTFNVAEGTNFNEASDLHYGTLTIQAKDVSETRTAEDQTVVKGIGDFTQPTFGALTGTLTYTYGSGTKTYEEIKADLAGKAANDTATIGYSFTPSDSNYTGTITGTINVTVVDVVFEVNGAAANATNALDIKMDAVYGDTWADIVKIKGGVTITAKAGSDEDTDPEFKLEQTGRPNAGNGQTYNLIYNGTINGKTYTNVVVITDTVDVASREVTVSGITANNKEYDGGTTATVNASTATITGKVDGDDLTVDASSASATFDNKNVDTDKTVTFTGYSLSGTDAGNYTLATTGNQTEAKADITARTLSITDAAVSNKPYDGNTTATVTDVTFGNLVVGESLTVGTDYTVSGVFNSENVNDANTVTVSITLKDTAKTKNYTLPIATFNKSGVNITKSDHPTYGTTQTGGTNALRTTAGAKTYNLPYSELAGVTYTVTAKTTVNIVDDVPTTITGNVLTYTSKVCATANATDTITIKIESTNYNDITLTLTVTATDKTPVTISGLTYANKTYDGNAITPAGTLAVSDNRVPVNELEVLYTSTDGAGYSAATAPKDAGAYKVEYKVADSNPNYTGSVSYTFTISKKAATVAPKAVSITKGSAIPAFELVYTGLVSGENLTPSAAPTFSCFEADGTTAVSTSTAAGTYTITWTNTSITFTGANNYDLTKTPTATLTISNPSYSGGGSYTPSYSITVDKTENGTITVSPKSASKGDTVTITVKPDKGYELEMLKALDKDGDALKLTEKNGKYTFKMPSGKVTVKGSFVEETPVQIFKDVPVDAYYYEAVKWAAEKGITGGVGNGLFAPNQPCTRAQIVTFLWRAAGSPAPKNPSTSFGDVKPGSFYEQAVAWAVENGITGGTGDGKFSPDATCTRAQAVTFLYRAAGSPKVSGSAEFGDVATNAYYADAVAWAAKNGITGGIGGGLFGSGNDCTRAQIVTFLYRSVK